MGRERELVGEEVSFCGKGERACRGRSELLWEGREKDTAKVASVGNGDVDEFGWNVAYDLYHRASCLYVFMCVCQRKCVNVCALYSCASACQRGNWAFEGAWRQGMFG